MVLKSPKMRKSVKCLKSLKNKHWKQCIWVKNRSGMNFIHLLQKIGMYYAKNAKPQYANEVKVRFFNKWPIR